MLVINLGGLWHLLHLRFSFPSRHGWYAYLMTQEAGHSFLEAGALLPDHRGLGERAALHHSFPPGRRKPLAPKQTR